MESLFGRFVNDESGATAIEYAFIAVLIAVVLVTALRAVGTELMSMFTGDSTELKNARQPQHLMRGTIGAAGVRVCVRTRLHRIGRRIVFWTPPKSSRREASMHTTSKPETDVSMVESVCGISLMLIAFSVAAYVMFGIRHLAAEAVRVPFLALPWRG
jgi:pilus assembly protein Flp/PilA